MDLGDLLRKLSGADDCDCDDCRRGRGLEPLKTRDVRPLTPSEIEELNSLRAIRTEAMGLLERLEMLTEEKTARERLFWLRVDRETGKRKTNHKIDSERWVLQEVVREPGEGRHHEGA